MFCNNCGSSVSGNFCPKCGNKVEKVDQNNLGVNNVSNMNNNYISNNVPNNNFNVSNNMHNNMANMIENNKKQNDKYAVLSIIMPIIGIISCFVLSIIAGLICVITGYEFARKGKFSTKANMAVVGKVLNIVSSIFIIGLWILNVLLEVNK